MILGEANSPSPWVIRFFVYWGKGHHENSPCHINRILDINYRGNLTQDLPFFCHASIKTQHTLLLRIPIFCISIHRYSSIKNVIFFYSLGIFFKQILITVQCMWSLQVGAGRGAYCIQGKTQASPPHFTFLQSASMQSHILCILICVWSSDKLAG